MLDTTKAEELTEKIASANIPKEIKEFLFAASKRHNIFNYEKIAEYYAHAPKEIQELMEDSALVIIDFNKAIEHGYVKLTQELQEQYAEDYDEE
jgi:hypothetical protein